jgi:hypothetical protein
MSFIPYLARGIVAALTQELDLTYCTLDITELDQAERAESWPDPIDAPARAWTVTIHQAYQQAPQQRLVCLDREEFFVTEEQTSR